MRACFLGQNICALGFGVAMVQSPPLHEPLEAEPEANMGQEPTAAAPADLPVENPMLRDLKRLPWRIGGPVA